jgi:signal peptidase II
MNRYITLILLALVWIVADQWTKQVAVDTLSSHTSRWQHHLERTVSDDDAGLNVEQWCQQNLGTDLEDPEEARSLRTVYRVSAPATLEEPEWLTATSILAAGDVLHVRHRQVTIVPGFWNHIYVQNFGAAWGMFSQASESFRKPFFFGISILAVIIMISILRTLQPGQWVMASALASIIGGAIGNFIDRIRYGYVIDFIDWYVTWGGEEKHWPTFNIADVAISVGVGLMAITMLFVKEPQEPGSDKTPGEPASPEPTPESTTSGS